MIVFDKFYILKKKKKKDKYEYDSGRVPTKMGWGKENPP